MPRLVLLLALLACGPARGQAPTLSARTDLEDGRAVVVATFRRGDAPVANATVAFTLQRSFGGLALGEDTTLADGTAAVPLPPSLPPDPDGSHRVELRITAPADLVGISTKASLPALGKAGKAAARPPRELWSRRAPISLVAVLLIAMAAVWTAYALVIRQLLLIKKGGSHA